MKVPGPKVPLTLQEPTESRTSTGGVSNEPWADLLTFSGSLGPLTAREIAAFDKETVISTHRVIVGYEEIGDTYATDVKEKNRIYVANTGNQLAAETFDITGVQPFRMYGNKIATFELMLRKVE
jgi:head-tail adaptor